MSRKLAWAMLTATAAILAACKEDSPEPLPAATYTIGGTVTGLTSSGLVLAINGANVTVASGATAFTSLNSLATGTAYAVTQGAKPATQTCTVSNGTGTVAAANVTNVAVNCATDTFTVAATVSGLVGTGLVLQLNGGAGLSFTGNGSQSFANRVDSGTAYAVIVLTQPSAPNQLCTVTNGSASSIGANVTNVTVACVSSISGVAAVGSPLAGTVTVKDASAPAIIRSTPLGSNGSYVVDVSGLTPPFVFRAEGTANGHTYVVHSAAVAADVGGNINITQLTDLVVDNIAGQVATAYYNNGDFSSLTPAALDAEVAILKQRLLPVLTALGVDASIDLLRSRFTPLVSALDDALDILRVTVDTVSNVATITNIVTQQAIQDTITVPAASESNPPQLDNTNNLASAITDSDAIRTAIASFSNMFATTLPSVPTIQAALTATFLNNDNDGFTTAADLASDSGFLGVRFTDVDIKNIDYTDLTQVTALVDFTIRDRNGVEDDRVPNFRVRKGTDGIWRLHGNQRVMDVEGHVHLYRGNGCTLTGLEFGIRDDNSANNGAVINHIMVYGPGLPAGGLRFAPPVVGGGDWVYTNVPTQPNSSYYRMANTCATGGQALSDTGIAAIPDNAAYVFAPFTSADNSVRYNFPSGAIPSGPAAGMYWVNIQKRPLTLAEVAASTQFPTITSPANAASFATYISGALTISATGFVPNTFADVILEQNTVSGNYRSADAWLVASSTGTISTSLSLTAPVGTINYRSLRVATKDGFRRTFMSGYDTQ